MEDFPTHWYVYFIICFADSAVFYYKSFAQVIEPVIDERIARLDIGVYIAVFHLLKAQKIQVGKLGQISFRRGYYFYVGSAQRNLSARIERHGRMNKSLRWHIDYLSVKAKMLGVILICGPRERECLLARALAGMYELAVAGFGSSDCRCNGHLFYAADFP